MGGDGKKKGEEGLQQTSTDLKNATKQTPDEAAQYSNSFDVGKIIDQIYRSQQGLGSAPAGYLNSEQQLQNQGPLAKGLYDQAVQGVMNPDQVYQSTLQPQLLQAQDAINSYYQKRGLLNSGLAIEGMGRAGVDLAIRQAEGMMANRQTQLQNALGISQYGNTVQQNTLGNWQNLYNTQQAAGQSSLGRQAAGAVQAAQYQAYPYQAQLGSYYGGQAALQALPGQALGAAAKVGAAYASGGSSLAAG